MKKFFNWHIKSRLANILLFILLPLLCVACLECYTHVPQDLTVPIFLLNAAFYYLLFWICTILTGKSSIGYGIAPVFPMIFGLVIYFVVDFRSSPIVPWDLYSLGTAFSVAGNYEYQVEPRLVLVILGFVLLILAGSRTGLVIRKKNLRWPALLLVVLLMGGYLKGVQTDTAVELFGLDTTLFTPNVLYRNNGLTTGFLANLKFLKVEKPDGYSPENAQEIADGIDKRGDGETSETTNTVSTSADTDLPNVIVIMDEAFSDLSVFGDFETDDDYMPFIHSLTENTVKGNCYVSVKGGNTANSEYEFLTGDSMAFLPAGSVPYQQYIKKEMPSLASYLKGLGYETAAIHPYNATGWARNKVYPWLGFDETYFKYDFENPQLIRNYISDSSAFGKIMELMDEKEDGKKLFTFEVTMQNHGGYSKDVDGFEETIHLTDAENKTTQVRAAEKYLTLMLKTDRAFETLVDYLKNSDEKTVVLLFGDHQPSDYITNTILSLTGRDRDGEDADSVYFDNYIVPFVIWANFDIEEEQVDAISVNYLGGLLFEKAGIPTTEYQNFLEELRDEIPAVTAGILMDHVGNRYRREESDLADSQLMKDYNILAYNHLVDTGHRLTDFYD